VINVGFIGAVSKEWMGGFNYFRNLLFALDSVEEKKLKIFVFIGKKTDTEIKSMFKEYATVVEDRMFDRKSLKWFMMKIEQKVFKTNCLLENVLKKYRIQVLSHASVTNLKDIKTINWIPDFQHLHLPQMFSEKEIKNRNINFRKIITKSDAVILSSYDALEDLKNFAPSHENKIKVLQFVSQPDSRYFELNDDDKKRLLNKYDIEDGFFYMPNQFWKHKNHMVVFKAINELKKEHIEICLVCTGHLDDYRNKTHIDEIKTFVVENDLEKHIRLLGLIDYEDVFSLMKFSKAVINPSLFEGWSSTVEECKSVGKNMILSDLDVHKEQYPEAIFFERNSVEDLKHILMNYSIQNINKIGSLEERTKSFAEKYVNIVEGVLFKRLFD